MKPAAGKVYLVGAGPGDAGLITVKGQDVLTQSDVVIHDDLVNADLLKSIPNHCRVIYAGKRRGHVTLSQDRINRLLVREAKKGKCVTRLKGGDPYLFGRGAEEGTYLHQCCIPFEVVPGITSALGCATYSGIPLTERHLSSSIAFVTAHHAGKSEFRQIRWSSLYQAVDTIAIYMGASKLSHLVREMFKSGCSAQMPAAMIQWGTWPKQKTSIGPLKTLPQRASSFPRHAPAIILVGKVVKLSSKLNWFEKRPLFGKRVVITRAPGQAHVLKAALESLGAGVRELPTLSIRPPKSFADLDRCIRNLSRYNWLIFTSANAVDAFFTRLTVRHSKDARTLHKTRIAVVGTSTRERLQKYGLHPDFVPKQFTNKALVNGLQKKYSLLGNRVLLIRSQIASQLLVQNLEKGRCRVDDVIAYQTLPIRQSTLSSLDTDAIVFTSSSSVVNFVGSVGRLKARRLLKGVKIFSIGPVTTQTVRAYRFRIYREAKVHNIHGLVSTLKKNL